MSLVDEKRSDSEQFNGQIRRYCAVSEEAKVFEDMPPFSLRSIMGKLIPATSGFVGACYRLDASYPRVSFYYTRKPSPSFVDHSALSLFGRVSTLSDRRRVKGDAEAASAASKGSRSSSSAADKADGCESDEGETAVEAQSTTSGSVSDLCSPIPLKENENTIGRTGYAANRLAKTSRCSSLLFSEWLIAASQVAKAASGPPGRVGVWTSLSGTTGSAWTRRWPRSFACRQ